MTLDELEGRLMGNSQFADEPLGVFCETFASKRRRSPGDYDFTVSMGFTPKKRWKHPVNKSKYIEFSLRRFEFGIHLDGGFVDVKVGDKLAEDMKTRHVKKITRTESRGRSKKGGLDISGNVSAAPSVGIKIVTEGQKTDGNSVSVEEEIETLYISADLSIRNRPTWTINPSEGEFLASKLSERDLCTASESSGCSLRHRTSVTIWPDDVVVSKPLDLFSNLRLIAIHRRGIEKLIALRINKHFESDENRDELDA